MKIIKYQKQKDGQYLLQLENGLEVLTYEELILKYELLIKKHIDEEDLKLLEEENKTYELYFLVLGYLKTKMRSIQEVRSYLGNKGYSNLKVNTVVEMLRKQGYLNDAIYAKAFFHDRLAFSQDGPLKIRQALEKLEVTESEITDILSEYNEELEEERIKKLVTKQIRSNHTKSIQAIKQKIYYNLLNLGYSSFLIEKTLSSVEENPESSHEIYQKEYQKLERKLSRKYQGKELEYQIRQKMYQKGFRNN